MRWAKTPSGILAPFQIIACTQKFICTVFCDLDVMVGNSEVLRRFEIHEIGLLMGKEMLLTPNFIDHSQSI